VSTELERRIGSRTDEDLYEMLYVHREDWTPEALAIAEREWNRRALTPERVAIVQSVGSERKQQREGVKDEPLSTNAMVLFFVFNFACGLGLLQLLMADSFYRSNGYERKFSDAVKSMAYGFAFYLAVALILRLLMSN